MASKVGVGVWAGVGSVLGLFAGSLLGASLSKGRPGAAAVVLPALAGTALGAGIAAALSAAEPNTTTVTTTTTGTGALPASPTGLGAVPHKCTAKSATAIAQQLPGAPWAYSRSMPPDHALRCMMRTQNFDVVTPMGPKNIPARFCGTYPSTTMILRCPYTSEQFLFESASEQAP